MVRPVFRRRSMRTSVVLLATLVTVPQAAAQQRALTAADYARAEKFLNYNTNPLVLGAAVRATWLPDERFWYRNAMSEGFEFVLVDPAKKTRLRAFDHSRLAAGLSLAASSTYEAFHLPFTQFEFSADGKAISFGAVSRHWTCDLTAYKCAGAPAQKDTARSSSVTSPDGKLAALMRSYNRWARDRA